AAAQEHGRRVEAVPHVWSQAHARPEGAAVSNLQPGTTMYRIDALERVARELRWHVRELRSRLTLAERRIRDLEAQTPQARQHQYEAHVAAADLAESGYDRWPPGGTDRHGPGCQCPECYDPEPEEYDPGPEVDDEGGMSEYRHPAPADPRE